MTVNFIKCESICHQLKDHTVLGLAEAYQCVVSLILSGSQISVVLSSNIVFRKNIYHLLKFLMLLTHLGIHL